MSANDQTPPTVRMNLPQYSLRVCNPPGPSVEGDPRKPKKGKGEKMSTQDGFKNLNWQKVVRRVGPSPSHPNPYTDELECLHCGQHYGANGCDIAGAASGAGRRGPNQACLAGRSGQKRCQSNQIRGSMMVRFVQYPNFIDPLYGVHFPRELPIIPSSEATRSHPPQQRRLTQASLLDRSSPPIPHHPDEPGTPASGMWNNRRCLYGIVV